MDFFISRASGLCCVCLAINRERDTLYEAGILRLKTPSLLTIPLLHFDLNVTPNPLNTNICCSAKEPCASHPLPPAPQTRSEETKNKILICKSLLSLKYNVSLSFINKLVHLWGSSCHVWTCAVSAVLWGGGILRPDSWCWPATFTQISNISACASISGLVECPFLALQSLLLLWFHWIAPHLAGAALICIC